MAEQLQPTGAAAGLAALQRTASEVALLKKAVTPRLQAQGQNLVSQGRSIESRESELAHERRDLVTADSELLSIQSAKLCSAVVLPGDGEGEGEGEGERWSRVACLVG